MGNINFENTVCYLVSELDEAIKESIKNNKKLNLVEVSKSLHRIRKLSQKMENGLKLRKELMEKHDLEKEYQTAKGKMYTPTGINKVGESSKYVKEKIRFEITIKEQGELVYQAKTHGAVVSIVEDIKDIDAFGTLNGTAQTFFAGHELAIYFAYDQLKQAYEHKEAEIMQVIQDKMLHKVNIDPQVKKQLLEYMSNK